MMNLDQMKIEKVENNYDNEDNEKNLFLWINFHILKEYKRVWRVK